MASATPVLPDVGSTMVLPRLSSPRASAASIISRAGRSFTLPPGLKYSSLASRWHGRSRPTRSRRTMGVPPMSSISAVDAHPSAALSRRSGTAPPRRWGDHAVGEQDGRQSRLVHLLRHGATGGRLSRDPHQTGDADPQFSDEGRRGRAGWDAHDAAARAVRMCGAGPAPTTSSTSTWGGGTTRCY